MSTVISWDEWLARREKARWGAAPMNVQWKAAGQLSKGSRVWRRIARGVL